jgi:hypothetical protein
VSNRNDLSMFDGVGKYPYGRRRRRNWLAWATRFGLVVLVIGGLVGTFLFIKAIATEDPVEVRVLGVDGAPLTGALVTTPQDEGTTGDGGAVMLVLDTPASVMVAAPGYKDGTYQVDALPEGPLSLQMVPHVLSGRVVDTRGNGIANAQVTVGETQIISGELGNFEVMPAEPGPVEVWKAAWSRQEVVWEGEETRLDVVLEPFTVRGIRVSPSIASDRAEYEALLDMAEGTVLNTLVFDTKSEGGGVHYDSQVPEAIATGAILDSYDPEMALRVAKERGYYTITRIVVFQDSPRGQLRPEHAVGNSATGGTWTTYSGHAWMDPTDEGSWTYPIDLAVEACHLGFDEIQFDYVRFPTDGDLSTVEYDVGELNSEIRLETVRDFLSTARDAVHQEGCAVSADIFAIVMSVSDDQGLGQRPEELSDAVDAISPMIYPSHYSNGWLGYDDPNSYPYEVTDQALDAGGPRVIGGAVLRPWLQAFSYTGAQVLDTIAAAEEGSHGWMLWHATSDYSRDMFPTE